MKTEIFSIKLILWLFVIASNNISAQIQDQLNNRVSQYPYITSNLIEKSILLNTQLDFILNENSLVNLDDASTTIQKFIDSIGLLYPNDNKVIILPSIGFKIKQPIIVNYNNLLILGDKDLTKITIENGENHGFVFLPKNYQKTEFKVSEKIRKDSNLIYVDSFNYNLIKMELSKGYRTMVISKNDDDDLITSSWAKGTIKEHFEILEMGKINTNKYFLKIGYLDKIIGLKFKMIPFLNYSEDTLKTSFYLENPIYNSGIACLKIYRKDSSTGQTSNILIQNGSQCLIKNIKSYKTNFSHVTLENSKFCVVKRCYFSNSHGFGGGGRGYGVTIHLGSSSNSILYNYADTLRHSFLLQAGANRNVIYGNYSTKSYWFSIPQDAAGDMVLHGNYVFNNLIEKNEFENIVLDNSHGKNGPNNIFFRNISTNYGLVMSTANGSDSQVFIGNEITNAGFLKGLFLLQDNGHLYYGNKVKGSLNPSNSSMPIDNNIFTKSPDNHIDTFFNNVRFVLKHDLNLNPIAGYPFNWTEKLLSKTIKDSSFNCIDLRYDRSIDIFFEEINLNNSQNEIKIYPNPTENYLEVINFKGTLKIYNIQGIQVFLEKIDIEENHKINFSDLSSGLYLINFYDINDNLIKVTKIVVGI